MNDMNRKMYYVKDMSKLKKNIYSLRVKIRLPMETWVMEIFREIREWLKMVNQKVNNYLRELRMDNEYVRSDSNKTKTERKKTKDSKTSTVLYILDTY